MNKLYVIVCVCVCVCVFHYMRKKRKLRLTLFPALYCILLPQGVHTIKLY